MPKSVHSLKHFAMQTRPLLMALATFTLLFASLNSCKKTAQDPTTDPEIENTAAATEDDASADLIFAEIGEQVTGIDGTIGLGQIDLFEGVQPGSPATESGTYNQGTLEAPIANDPQVDRCFKITVTPKDPAVFPKTVVIDYGTGCKGRDGKTRKGKVITVFSKPMVVPGAQALTEFEGHFVNDIKVEGKLTIRNSSTSSILKITRIVQNGKLTHPNGNFIWWNAEHHLAQVAGLGTPGFARDDEWEITGGARGQSQRGTVSHTWSRQISLALHKAFPCRWIDKGQVKITRNDKTALLDYGSGACDNLAWITINGQRREIKLP